MAWDNTYENTPLNGDDPGEGALELRTLKGEISKRNKTEHFWGTDEENLVARLGAHKEGSARSYVLDPYDASPERPDRSTNLDNIGSIRVTYLDNPSAPQLDGENAVTVSDDDTMFQKIEVRTYVDAIGTLGWITVFDKADFLNLKFDQTVNGRKDFTLNPEVPYDPEIGLGNVGSQWFTAAMNAIGAGGYVAPALSNVRDQLIYMLTKDAYNPEGAFAQWIDTVDNTYIGTTGYVDRTIKASIGDFETLTGAVWV